MADKELGLKKQKLLLLEQKKKLEESLPHLYGYKHYRWSLEFFLATQRECFLVAANQIGKSSCQIRKAIHWATAKHLWPQLWKSRPLTFWYLYPAKDVATVEFEKKWTEEFLPRGEMKDHAVYGWHAEYKNKQIFAIHFKSGVSIYFKSYAQDVSDLQTGTVWALFCDEELPEELWSELNMRRTATRGYFHSVFTATLGQEFWREAMEERGEKERFKDAFKRQVSMYDCITYADGTTGNFAEADIVRTINSCKNEAEVQRRVFGRFVSDSGLKYPGFSPKNNVRKPKGPIPHDWLIYGAADIGSGGDDGHPSAITFIAVRPDYKYGRVFRGWRGDGVLTTAGDVLRKFQDLRGDMHLIGQYYDFHCRDFLTIATRAGETFEAAEKSHEIGEQVLNVLFRNNMLDIDDIEELWPLIRELRSLKVDTPKRSAKDDAADSLRYAATRIPWDWTAINKEKILPMRREMTDAQRRRAEFLGQVESSEEQAVDDIENELLAWEDEFEL